jgi:TonB family protein
MGKDSSLHSWAEAPQDFLEKNSFLEKSSFLGKDSFPGQGSAIDSLSSRLIAPLTTGFIPFEIAPTRSSEPGGPTPPGQPPLMAGEQVALPSTGGALGVWLGRTGAFSVHLGAIYLMMQAGISSDDFGASGQRSDAISTNTTWSQVIESISEIAPDKGAASQTPLAENTPEPEPTPEQNPAPKPDETLVMATPNPEAPALAPEPIKPPEEKKEEEKREEKKIEAPKPKPVNVAVASGQSVTPGQAGRVAASYGSALSYNHTVRSKIAAHKPQGVENQGTAIVKFEISEKGGLMDCHVVASSGSVEIDNAALRAVRNASPFSPPPEGRAVSFTIPFKFH